MNFVLAETGYNTQPHSKKRHQAVQSLSPFNFAKTNLAPQNKNEQVIFPFVLLPFIILFTIENICIAY